MNNGSGEAQPHFEVPAPPQGGEVQHGQVMEQGAPDESRVGRAQPPPPAAAPPPPPPPSPADDSQAPPADQIAASGIKSSGGQANNVHVIERQWVDKTKSIIAQTQEDPYIQKKEISKVKAEYIQKRFNKTIPTDDTVAA